MILTVRTPSNQASKYIKQMLTEMKGEKADKSTTIFEDYNAILSVVNRTKRISLRNGRTKQHQQLAGSNWYRTHHPTIASTHSS